MFDPPIHVDEMSPSLWLYLGAAKKRQESQQAAMTCIEQIINNNNNNDNNNNNNNNSNSSNNNNNSNSNSNNNNNKGISCCHQDQLQGAVHMAWAFPNHQSLQNQRLHFTTLSTRPASMLLRHMHSSCRQSSAAVVLTRAPHSHSPLLLILGCSISLHPRGCTTRAGPHQSHCRHRHRQQVASAAAAHVGVTAMSEEGKVHKAVFLMVRL